MTSPLQSGLPPRFYFWNVGQGQWLTWSDETRCLHFDMGGERAPLRRIRELCRYKTNVLYLSHSDEDHLRFIPWGVRSLPELCLHALPRENLSWSKQKILSAISLCGSK